MKDIVENEKAKTLVQFIQNNEDDTKIINKLYDTYIKLHGSDNVNNLKDWVDNQIMLNDNNEIHRKTLKKSIFSGCDEHSCWEQIINLYNKRNNPEEENQSYYQIFTKDNENKDKFDISFDDICKYYENDPFKIPKDFFDTLFNSVSGGQPAVGKGEFVLKFISKSTKKSGGDININDHTIEVKDLTTNEASLGNNQKGNVAFIFNILNNILNDKENKIVPQTISISTKYNKNNNNLTNIKNAINKIKDIDKDKLRDIFKDHLDDFYFKGNIKNQKEDYNNIIDLTINKLKEVNIEENFKEFIKIITALYVVIYCTEEDAEYLCIVKKDNNNKIFKFIKINDNTFEHILEDNNFPFDQIRYSGSKEFVQLSYKKNK